MRIVIVNTQAPFVHGGAEEHANGLCTQLRAAGHEAEIVTMPFNWQTAESVLEHALAATSLDLSSFFGDTIDLMIGLRFPAYYMKHPNKAVWLIHQHREAYDLWDAGMSSLRHDPKGNLVRQIIGDMDHRTFSDACRLFTNSSNVSRRLKKYNGIQAEPLYHPPPMAERLHSGEYEDYFYYPSRISGLKRQELVLDALALCKTDTKVIFTGKADSHGDEVTFRGQIEALGLGERVEWRGIVPVDDLITLYANARAILYTPLDEDLGYVTLEAMLAEKPVITTRDAGGPLEFVNDQDTGLVVKPDPAALAAAMDRLQQNKDLAVKLGKQARKRYDSMSISWDKVIKTLTGAS